MIQHSMVQHSMYSLNSEYTHAELLGYKSAILLCQCRSQAYSYKAQCDVAMLHAKLNQHRI